MRIFTSVDLPAPLEPSRATTSPASSVSSTLLSTGTPPKDLPMPRIESRAVLDMR